MKQKLYCLYCGELIKNPHHKNTQKYHRKCYRIIKVNRDRKYSRKGRINKVINTKKANYYIRKRLELYDGYSDYYIKHHKIKK